MIAKNNRLEIYEGCNGYYIHDTKTDQTVGIGDGVDLFLDQNGATLAPGSPEFNKELRRMIRNEKSELLKAYFNE